MIPVIDKKDIDKMLEMDKDFDIGDFTLMFCSVFIIMNSFLYLLGFTGFNGLVNWLIK